MPSEFIVDIEDMSVREIDGRLVGRLEQLRKTGQYIVVLDQRESAHLAPHGRGTLGSPRSGPVGGAYGDGYDG